jgi:predicted metal-dependent HD superfamily phosphohydrolase
MKELEKHINPILKEKIFNDLSKKLDKKYSYHNIDHTNRVINAAINIARNYDITDDDWKCLLTACLLHDYGFIESHIDHEEIGVKLSSEILPNYGFSSDKIDLINSLILATKLINQPKNILESIIRDSDLEYLGSDDFKMVYPSLKEEWINCSVVKDDSEFYKLQFQFLSKHNFYTDYMINNTEGQKITNIKYAEKMMRLHH